MEEPLSSGNTKPQLHLYRRISLVNQFCRASTEPQKKTQKKNNRFEIESHVPFEYHLKIAAIEISDCHYFSGCLSAKSTLKCLRRHFGNKTVEQHNNSTH